MFLPVQTALRKIGNPEKAKFLKRFFKTGKGQYAEGDRMLGITVPEQRKVAKKFSSMDLDDVLTLLHSGYHEERLTALLILVHQFEHGDVQTRKKIFYAYLKNTTYVNNWDLVDLSAPRIVGAFLSGKKGTGNRQLLKKLALSKHLWERRIAIVATLFFIVRDGEFDDTLNICEMLLKDRHDLIHKACGWMLREVGKRDEKVLEKFLDTYLAAMPRTMLRYSIERMDRAKKDFYMGR